ncbi:MAG: right-handed parallel beta-helix repeat-containing protein [Bryobacterales bacterium]|nr:right-handed parallel beta-helix repeat-containing protein [Bryobacterales bacterium]
MMGKPFRSVGLLLAATWIASMGCSVLAGGVSCPPSDTAARCLQQAINAAEDDGVVRLAAGDYVLEAPLQLKRKGLTLTGEGDATVLRRAVTVEQGEGLLNVRASGVALRRFRLDGQVSEPAAIPYIDPAGGPSVLGAPIHGDPMHPELLRNTSITIHPGVQDITFEELTIERTGGYAILIDARYGGIKNVNLRRLRLRDNCPHVFGKQGDLRYGSWTGGIHYQNDGRDLDFARHALASLTIEDSEFERISGHAIWGHGYGFQTLNEAITVRRNRFTDIGMDAVLVANAQRAVVEENQFLRIGYVSSSAGELPRPAWYPGMRLDGMDNIPAVGIDTSGLVRDSVYRKNHMRNVNGHCIDLDGFTRGDVVDNTMRVSGREDAWNYVNDQVTQFGGHQPGNFTKGINLSNTSGAALTEQVRIEGNTLINMGGFAIALNDSQHCTVAGNHIRHYGQHYGPVILTNSLREPRERHVSRQNVVRDNYIHFYLEAWCVTEADDYSGAGQPVEGPNTVHGNTCDANTHGEFAPGRQSKSQSAAP